ncbi:MAG TPA: hypothetical protein VIK84_04025 [Haloplasmataceae bacterium]
MKVNEFNEEMKVYYSAQDRFVKKISDHIFEVYQINVIENENFLYIKTINYEELNLKQINDYLKNRGLKYLNDKNIIVHLYDESKVVFSDQKLIKYVLADKLAISGAASNQNQFAFEDAKELNEILLEHDIYHQFDNATLRSL